MSLSLHATGVTKRFDGDAPVLRDVALTLAPGTVTVVEGAAGGGKSTLMRCLAGSYRLDEGWIGLRAGGGEELELSGADARTVAWLRREHVGLVDGRLVAAPREPAIAAAARTLEYAGVDPAQARGRARELLAALDLERLAETPVGLLPEQALRAIAVGRALLRPPGVLLVDEPTRGLADGAARHVVALLAEARRAGSAVLAAVRPGEAFPAVADRTLRLDEGALA